MSDQRRFGWFSGGIIWTPLTDLWQVDGLARTIRDPSIPSLPLEDNPADVTREPTVQTQQRLKRDLATFVANNLLLTTLAVTAAAAPFTSRSEAATPSHIPRQVIATQQANLLTSTLAAPAVLDVKRGPTFAQQQRLRHIADTSAGTPLALRTSVAATAPVGEASFSPPIGRTWHQDTSQGTPLTLRTVVVAEPPVGRAAFVAPLPRPWKQVAFIWRPEGAPDVQSSPLPVGAATSMQPPPRKWLPQDESFGTAKTLYGDDFMPGSNQYEQLSLRDARRGVTDTSASMPITLQAPILPPPIGKVSSERAPDPRRSVTDTSTSTNLALRTVVILPPPIGQASIMQPPEPRRVVVDTSGPTTLALRTAVPPPLPVGQASIMQPPWRKWLPQEESVGVAKTLYGDDFIPSVNAYLETSVPAARRSVTDTSQSSPLALVGVVPDPLPPGQASFVGAPRGPWCNPSTTAASPLVALHQVLPLALPPGQASFVAAPRGPWTNGDTTQQSPPVAIYEVEPAPTVNPTSPTFPGGGGIDRKLKWPKSKHDSPERKFKVYEAPPVDEPPPAVEVAPVVKPAETPKPAPKKEPPAPEKPAVAKTKDAGLAQAAEVETEEQRRRREAEEEEIVLSILRKVLE